MRIIDFRCDVTDVSDKTATLHNITDLDNGTVTVPKAA